MITRKDYYNEDDNNILYEDFDGALVEILSNEMSNREYQEVMNYVSYLYLSYWSQKAYSWRQRNSRC